MIKIFTLLVLNTLVVRVYSEENIDEYCAAYADDKK